MEPISIAAIYILFWVMSAFLVLPFGIRNRFETGDEPVAGQEHGAPANFRPLRVLLLTTLVATVAFALFYLNYVNGWLVVDDIDFFDSRAKLENAAS